MSAYLVERIAGLANVEVVDRRRGLARWRAATERSKRSAGGRAAPDAETRRACRHLFLFIGADPNTDWLRGSGLRLDARGFVLTGPEARTGCLPLETSRPGVFAVGDVRARIGQARRLGGRRRRPGRRRAPRLSRPLRRPRSRPSPCRCPPDGRALDPRLRRQPAPRLLQPRPAARGRGARARRHGDRDFRPRSTCRSTMATSRPRAIRKPWPGSSRRSPPPTAC